MISKTFFISRVGSSTLAALTIFCFVLTFSGCDQIKKVSLLKAVKNREIQKIEDLIQKGADANARDKDGNPAIVLAARTNSPVSIDLLVGGGADINSLNNSGNSALMVAAKRGILNTMQILLNHGAALEIENTSGMTAIEIASRNQQIEAARLLRSSGSQITGILRIWKNDRSIELGTMLHQSARLFDQNILKISPDGRKVAAPVDSDSGDVQVEINGKKASGSYDSVKVGSFVFSPDSRSLTCAVSLGEQWTVLLDGIEGSWYDEILNDTPFFTAYGQLIYGALKENSWSVVVDGVEMYTYDNLGILLASSGGESLAYSAEVDGRGHVYLDGNRGQAYASIGTSMAFSPDGSRLAYIAMDGNNKSFVVLDGKEEKKYQSISSLVFSPDSLQLAYLANNGNFWTVVVDGSEIGKYDSVSSVVFSPDSTRFAYHAAINDKWVAVVDGKEGKPYDAMLINTPVFSPDSRRVAYGAKSSITKSNVKWYVVADGRESEPYGAIGTDLVFSPDSTHLAHGVFIADEGWSVAVDGLKGIPYLNVRIVERDCIQFDTVTSFRYHFITLNSYDQTVDFHYREEVIID